ncbi:MAG: hypothetical protein ACRD3O_13940, partial [Terriglobia bacterium]
AGLCRRYHPQVKMVASGIGADLADEDMLQSSLRQASWSDCAWELPRGPKPVIKGALNPEITMVNGWGHFGPTPVLGTIKHAWQSEQHLVAGDVHYSEGIHDDVNKFALRQFAQDPQQSVNEVGRAYAEDWLGLSGRDAALVGEVISGLGTRIEDYNYFSPDYGAENPRADERLKTLIDVRERIPGLKDNFRYWLLQFRAVWESFSTITGSLPLETLIGESETAYQSFARLEPEYNQSLLSG